MKSPSKAAKPRAAKPRAARAAKSSDGFTAEERAAMTERAREMKASASREDGERELLAKIAEMPDDDRQIAERLHAVITANAPSLASRTWYGMPAYATDDGVLCFFQSAAKFKSRYATLGFSAKAKLDDGRMWPTGFALTGLGDAEETQVIALLERALG